MGTKKIVGSSGDDNSFDGCNGCSIESRNEKECERGAR